MKIKPSEALMVGDSVEKDIKGAKKLGIHTCFAKYGMIKKVKKSGAEVEINKIEGLLKIIK